VNSDRYVIDGDSFQAEFLLNPVTHRVVAIAPILEWMAGFDRLQVFRVAARRGWRILHGDKTNPNEQPVQTLQPNFQGAHAVPLPGEADGGISL